ncbi:ABC transporter ATP-binding protein [Tepidibacter formicigenes]|jgi:ABC-type nitrate/sulfonate/bicarbonate transport system ATPase subunit|uniref:ABC-type nitrate/sulfonate/bicarbonate transport system, ATPase component n=1 Tax=Tepidibacter formicigenes DSM 15518 TaxID=1123349 RepID=A0A1M6NA21_9FIRM|nr:ABC transporter ATP-binding protein [Tepidibacter formicigenes]SHJ92507.1 ABC-type nitrate/sulfonate/bicarbonate transport system, ATPase component [Tepidibacter formicigenes DSM 15518]
MSTYHSKLKVKNLKKYFDDNLIIDNISIDLNENEFVSILGPSGSGKSTIFNIVSGLALPDEGNIIINGEDFTGKSGKVSYMHQKDLLMPWRKIIDNVALPLLIKGESKKKSREIVKGYFSIFGLEGFEYKYPFQLSGGMRQRAALMRTYMFSKDIMLLDEPFGGLDAITKSKMHDWLLDVLDSLKATILFITHDVEEAVFLSDRIYILSERPAGIKEEIIVDLPKPRNKEIITSKEFNNIKKYILDIL